MDEFPILEDDGLIVEEIGPWALDKYRLVSYYSSLFVKAIRAKWDQLVYIDLFSGPGRSVVKGKEQKIIPAIPLRILDLPA